MYTIIAMTKSYLTHEYYIFELVGKLNKNVIMFLLWARSYAIHKHDVLANANAFQYVMNHNGNYTNTLEMCYAYKICIWHSLLPIIIWMHFITLQNNYFFSSFVMLSSINNNQSINQSASQRENKFFVFLIPLTDFFVIIGS